MKIYIASSWRNQHGVELLTAALRQKGHEVASWVENCDREGWQGFKFEEWVLTPEADDCFWFDVNGATKSDLCIYYGPAGKDACCEMGAAWAKGVHIVALYAKGEDLGLMRKMVSKWFNRYTDLLAFVQGFAEETELAGMSNMFPNP